MVILKKNKKQIPQYLHFRCGITHLNYSLEKLGKTFKLPKSLWKTEMNHDDIDVNNYKNKKRYLVTLCQNGCFIYFLLLCSIF